VKDINPGTAQGSPRKLTNVAGRLFFSARHAGQGRELWESDGTAEGTHLVKDINPGPGNSGASSLTNVDGTRFFSATDGTHGHELWKAVP
jgi:ELWxxDGT repeat protein